MYGTGLPDPQGLANAVIGKCSMISGHVRATKYVAAFGLRSTVTLLRSPLERYISEFNHHVGRGFKGTWRQHIKMRRNYVGGHVGERYTFLLSAQIVPMQAYGFIGLTDQYEQTLELFDAAYGTNLTVANKNRRSYKMPEDASDLDEELKVDNALYATAKVIFRERLRIMKACKPYAHGGIDSVDGDTVRGWAWWARSDEALSVRILIDGKDIGKANAELPHRLLEFGAPRNGYVGFVFKIPASDQQRTLRCEVAETGQLLGEQIVPRLLQQSS